MPARGIAERAEQLSLLEGITHQRLTSSEVGDILESMGSTEEQPMGDPSQAKRDRALLRQLRRAYSRASKLPQRLVKQLAATASRGQATWQQAREEDDYYLFAPVLREIIDLQLEVAEHIGYEEDPYDALLDGYEPWIKTSAVAGVFDALQRELVPLVRSLRTPGTDSPLPRDRRYPLEAQRAFGEEVLRHMGYESERGRLDVSAHPFTMRVGADDVRITGRFREDAMLSGIYGMMHEAGHALYELGLPEELQLSILGEAASMGIHESQARLWENVIGRSRSFWTYFFPRLREYFPEQLVHIDLEDFYRSINRVQPSPIRVDADEVTYILHIILRFNMERAIIGGSLDVDDIPDAWREESRRLLGVIPERDRDGVLQDIHWSTGGFGYFPSYGLGDIYAAQFAFAMRRDVAELDHAVRRGNLSVVLQWLRRTIHVHGSIMTAEELCNHVTGEYLNPQYFLTYIREKYRDLYGVL
jgi:carboxypeptidase Taq